MTIVQMQVIERILQFIVEFTLSATVVATAIVAYFRNRRDLTVWLMPWAIDRLLGLSYLIYCDIYYILRLHATHTSASIAFVWIFAIYAVDVYYVVSIAVFVRNYLSRESGTGMTY